MVVFQVLAAGWANRTVAATSMNRESSRSHAVFTLHIESKVSLRSSLSHSHGGADKLSIKRPGYKCFVAVSTKPSCDHIITNSNKGLPKIYGVTEHLIRNYYSSRNENSLSIKMTLRATRILLLQRDFSRNLELA